MRRWPTRQVLLKVVKCVSRADAAAARHEPDAPMGKTLEPGGALLRSLVATRPTAAPDVEICAYARENGHVLVTNDLDFPQILAHTAAAGPSVILLRGEPLTPEVRATALLSGIAECAGELDAGALLTIDWSGKPRARLLPLR